MHFHAFAFPRISFAAGVVLSVIVFTWERLHFWHWFPFLCNEQVSIVFYPQDNWQAREGSVLERDRTVDNICPVIPFALQKAQSISGVICLSLPARANIFHIRAGKAFQF